MKNNQNFQKANNQSNNDLGRNIAIAGVAAAGAAGVGGAAGYAATMLNDEEVAEEEVSTDDVVTDPAPAQEPQPQVVERVVIREVPAEQEAEEVEEEAGTYDLENAEVSVLEVGETESGGYYAGAVVDDHRAVFVDVEGDGIVDSMGVDVNDNEQLEDNEIFDVSEHNIGMDNLAAAIETTPEQVDVSIDLTDPNNTPTPDSLDPSQVQVEEVATDVNMEGYQVNMASVSYQGHTGMAVDADQDGDAEMVAIDMNDSNSYEDDEFYNASEGALMMEANAGGEANPTVVEPEPMPEPEPDVYNDPSNGLDGLPDYTNDGNIDGYVI